MQKYPVLIKWEVSKLVMIEANTEAGALDQAQNEQMVSGDPVQGSMTHHILTPKE